MIINCSHRSPNYNRRPPGARVSCIVLHADGDASVSSAIDWCCRPESKVSYHAIVGRKGDLYELVDPIYRAWHAGVSSFNGVRDCNGYSVGLCLSNKQDGKEPFTNEALHSAALYAAELMHRFPAITLDRITMHSAVALPKGRKADPAPNGPFDLQGFRALVREVTA